MENLQEALSTLDKLYESYNLDTYKTIPFTERKEAQAKFKELNKEGTLDYEVFHKAYDSAIKQYAEDKVDSLFDEEGKLLNKQTYGTIKEIQPGWLSGVLKNLWSLAFVDNVVASRQEYATKKAESEKEEEIRRKEREKEEAERRADHQQAYDEYQKFIAENKKITEEAIKFTDAAREAWTKQFLAEIKAEVPEETIKDYLAIIKKPSLEEAITTRTVIGPKHRDGGISYLYPELNMSWAVTFNNLPNAGIDINETSMVINGRRDHYRGEEKYQAYRLKKSNGYLVQKSWINPVTKQKQDYKDRRQFVADPNAKFVFGIQDAREATFDEHKMQAQLDGATAAGFIKNSVIELINKSHQTYVLKTKYKTEFTLKDLGGNFYISALHPDKLFIRIGEECFPVYKDKTSRTEPYHFETIEATIQANEAESLEIVGIEYGNEILDTHYYGRSEHSHYYQSHQISAAYKDSAPEWVKKELAGSMTPREATDTESGTGFDKFFTYKYEVDTSG